MSCNCGDYAQASASAGSESETDSASVSEGSGNGYEQRRYSSGPKKGAGKVTRAYKAPNGKMYPKRLGNREEVFHGDAYKTSGGLVAKDIAKKGGKYVSRRASASAKERFKGSKFAAEVEKRRGKR